jgi:uncharacterized protein YlxW (UPF0749 family)
VAEHSPAWRVAVPVIALAAGALFATSSHTARGTDLRPEQRDLAELVAAQRRAVDAAIADVRRTRTEVDNAARVGAAGDAELTAAQRLADSLAGAAGTEAVHGPALTVVLDDAPRSPDGSLPEGVTPDDVVVHQQDVQAVVNALWAGGAEAMRLMDQRVISTSAVRCVGNTLLLQGVVYSPPYRITAIGDIGRMRTALDKAPLVELYREYADALGLGYEVTSAADVRLPAYTGSLDLPHIRGAA